MREATIHVNGLTYRADNDIAHMTHVTLMVIWAARAIGVVLMSCVPRGKRSVPRGYSPCALSGAHVGGPLTFASEYLSGIPLMTMEFTLPVYSIFC